MSNYKDLLRKLYNRTRIFEKKSLEDVRQLSKYFGSPETKLKCIHIAGTNGKGSVTHKLSKVFEMSQYKCGKFISPHLTTFRERIEINSEMISKEYIEYMLPQILQKADESQLNIGFFEVTFMLALKYFMDNKVDFACIEAGIGGRLDATNIIPQPLVSIITSIGLDHVELLGDTIQQITREKAGIVKYNVPCVIGPSVPADIVKEFCDKYNSKLFQIQQNQGTLENFDSENINIVKMAVDILKNQFYINPVLLQEALESKLQCREEVVQNQILKNIGIKATPKAIILDVAHNEAAINRILLNVRSKYGEEGVIYRVVYGTTEKKNVYQCLEKMILYSKNIHLVTGQHPKCVKIDKFNQEIDSLEKKFPQIRDYFEPIINQGDINSTLDYILNQNSLKNNEVIIILGSFYIMPEVRKYFKYNDEFDDIY